VVSWERSIRRCSPVTFPGVAGGITIWGRGGVLPWVLLVMGSVASLAANVAVAEPSVTGRVIAAWPSFALIGSYEKLLMCQVRRAASRVVAHAAEPPPRLGRPVVVARRPARSDKPGQSLDVRWQAWQRAAANRDADGSLPSGKVIADRFGRHERWDRLVKAAGAAGELADTTSS